MPFNDFDDVKSNLPSFMNVFFRDFKAGGKNQNWSSFHTSYLSAPNLHVVRYEDLLSDGPTQLLKTVEYLGLPSPLEQELKETYTRFSFEAQTTIKAGEERTDKFLRKGISGDWKNYFTSEACAVFNQFYGQTLIQLGYEEDHNWY